MIEYVDSSGDKVFIRGNPVTHIRTNRIDGETKVFFIGGDCVVLEDPSGDAARQIREYIEAIE